MKKVIKVALKFKDKVRRYVWRGPCEFVAAFEGAKRHKANVCGQKAV